MSRRRIHESEFLHLRDSVRPMIACLPVSMQSLINRKLGNIAKINVNLWTDMKARGATSRVRQTIHLRRIDPAVFFHELIHLIGGNEVDAEAAEVLVGGNVMSIPDHRYDRPIFEKVDGYGKYLNWREGAITYKGRTLKHAILPWENAH